MNKLKLLYKARLLTTLMASLLLVSCADDPKIKQPTELGSFKTEYHLQQNWQTSSGDGVKQQYIYLQPLLLKQKIITISHNGELTILNRDNGDIEEEISLNISVYAGLAGNDETWVLATQDAHIIAIDANTHKIKWKKRVPTEVLTNPLLFNNEHVIVRTINGNILSLNLEDGKTRWQYHRSIPDLSLHGTNATIITRDNIIAGFADGRLMAVSADTGNVVWDIALAVPKGRSEVQRLVDIDGSAELYGHTLYIASFQGKVGALDVSTGQFLWARNFSSYTGVTVDSKALYSSDEFGNLWALDKESGATLWKQEKLAYRKLSRPTIMGDYLAVGDYDGYIHLLSRFDGHFVARYQVGQYDNKGWQHEASIIIPPIALTDNNLLLQTQGGGLYAFSLKKNVEEDDE